MTRSCGIVLFALAKALSSVGRFLRGSSVPTVRMKGRLILFCRRNWSRSGPFSALIAGEGAE